MRKILSRIVSVLIVIIIILAFYSWVKTSSFKTLEFDLAKNGQNLQSNRVSQTNFTFSMSHLTGYNYFLASPNLKTIAGIKKYKNSFIHADVDFFSSNKLEYVGFEIVFSGLLDPVNMSVDFKKLNKMKAYYSKFYTQTSNDQEKHLQFSVSHFLDSNYEGNLGDLSVNYAQDSGRTKLSIYNQMVISYELLKDNGLKYKNLVVDSGFISKKEIDLVGLGFARLRAINRVAKNYHDTLIQLEQRYPQNSIRLLLKNNSPLKRVISKNSELASINKKKYLLGFNPQNLSLIRNKILQLNLFSPIKIKNLNKKIGFYIDSSNLIDYIVNTNKKELTNTKKNSVNYLLKVYQLSENYITKKLSKIVTLFNGQNLLHGLALSTNNPLNESQNHLPLSRAFSSNKKQSKKIILSQLNYFNDLYLLSDIGLKNDSGLVSFSMPRRTLFPLLHYILKPIAEKMQAFVKLDGANRWEQEYSLKLITTYFNLKQ